MSILTTLIAMPCLIVVNPLIATKGPPPCAQLGALPSATCRLPVVSAGLPGFVQSLSFAQRSHAIHGDCICPLGSWPTTLEKGGRRPSEDLQSRLAFKIGGVCSNHHASQKHRETDTTSPRLRVREAHAFGEIACFTELYAYFCLGHTAGRSQT